MKILTTLLKMIGATYVFILLMILSFILLINLSIWTLAR